MTLLLAGALFAANCGGGGGTPSSPSPTGTGGGSNDSTVTIAIKGVDGKLSFSPNPASVAAGQMVVFRNDDKVTHSVTLDDASVKTGDIAPGQSSQPLPLGAVNKAYHCLIHPSMVGSLNTAATPDPQPCTGYCG